MRCESAETKTCPKAEKLEDLEGMKGLKNTDLQVLLISSNIVKRKTISRKLLTAGPFDRRHCATARCILAPWQPRHLSHRRRSKSPSGRWVYFHFDETILVTSKNFGYSLVGNVKTLEASSWFCYPFGTLMLSHTEIPVAQSHFSGGGSCPFSTLLPSSLKHIVSYSCNTVVLMSCF